MFALDLFNTRFEQDLNEGAVDKLEARRIEDLNAKMDDLLDRARTANPEMKAALKREFAKVKEERDSYYKIREGEVTKTSTGLKHKGTYGSEYTGVDREFGKQKHHSDLTKLYKNLTKNLEQGMDVHMDETGIPGNVPTEKIPGKEDLLKGKGRSYYEAGIPGSVPTEKIPGKEDLLKGKGRSYYEAAQKKNSEEVTEDQRLNVGDPVVVTAPNDFEGKTGEIYDFSPSGSFIIVDLYNYGKHSMHLSDVEYNQYADDQAEEDDWYDDGAEDTLEGWSNKMVAQRTGQAPTPYSVYIKGKEWKSFPDDDHAENVANKLRAKFKAEGRDPSVITIAPTGYDKMTEGFGTGSKVQHPKYGAGQVYKVYPNGMISVNFPQYLDPITKKPGITGNFNPGSSDYQSLKEAETDYSKRRARERDVDAGKPVAKQRTSKMTDYQKRRAQQKKEMELGEDDPMGGATIAIGQPAGATADLSEEQDTSGVERAILHRIMVANTDLLMKFGPEKVMQAAEEVAYNVGDVDEIGSSDVSAYVNQVKQILGVPEEVNEKWSQKYKSSINCANPKGFSQKAHCAGKKK